MCLTKVNGWEFIPSNLLPGCTSRGDLQGPVWIQGTGVASLPLPWFSIGIHSCVLDVFILL